MQKRILLACILMVISAIIVLRSATNRAATEADAAMTLAPAQPSLELVSVRIKAATR